MKEIKSINKKSLAKITALIYGLTGFFVALLVAVYTMIGIIKQPDFQGSVFLVILYNFGAGLLLGILTSLLTALCGYIIGFITAATYNWFAGKAGGIKVDVEEAEKAKKLNN